MGIPLFSRPDRRLLYEVFEPEPGGDASFALTESGIWHPTPLDVLLPALEAAVEVGWFGGESEPLTVLDAGSGDGRVVGALSMGSGLSPTTRVLGLESNAQLDARAVAHLGRLDPKRPIQVARGNFLDPASYDAFGIRPREIDVFLNYPDGNEQALAVFIADAAPSARLLVLSPDHGLRLEGLELRRTLAVARLDGGPGWAVSRFGAS